jgi:hypothetical protein
MDVPPRALLRDLQGVLVTNTATRHHEQLLQELRQLGFVLEAKGLSLGRDGAGRGKAGRKLSTVQGNGNLLVGKA